MSKNLDGFVPIHSIFYAIFHPTEGTKIRFQFPPDSLKNSGISFDTIKNYIIPKPQLCNKLLTFKYKSYRLVCFPVNVNAPYYARNSFSFDFVFVFPYDSPTSPYEPAIIRLGKMFRILEEQSQFLSKIERDPVYYQLKTQDTNQLDHSGEDSDSKNGSHASTKKTVHNHAHMRYHEIMRHIKNEGKQFYIEDLITKLYEDLNNYSECLIPMDSGNAIDIKLFPLLPPPNSSLSLEDVPLSKVNLLSLVDVNWDPTMVKIVPYINGINSIAKIAKCSNSDIELVLECVKHLLYYDCVVLVDIFQFSNIYAPTSQLREFLTDPSISKECQIYVLASDDSGVYNFPFEGRSSPNSRDNMEPSSTIYNTHKPDAVPRADSFTSHQDGVQKNSMNNSFYLTPSYTHSSRNSEFNQIGNQGYSKRTLPTKSCLFDLYRSLSQAQTVSVWYKLNYDAIRENQIDVRRFITFGIIKKLIYRCYSYPVVKTIGTLDMLKRFDYADVFNTFIDPKKDNSNNVFSTSDIKVDFDQPLPYKNKSPYVSSSQFANESFRENYQKPLRDGLPTSFEGGRKYSMNEGDNFKHSRKQSSSTNSTATVVFDIGEKRGNKEHDRRDRSHQDVISILRKKRQQEFLLLQSVHNVDNSDKIAMRLQMTKHEVELLLRGIGEYHIINS
ncbi:HCR008Wp [Eremothecium sinecaudum]|uniref:HCR008Wp n=1 Tax=Eremothecium sinecaudum TaxID=45286 RepID=A0A109UYK3_9SACH|nr:HCR008Wp [Eremothecium sinecaudum]AMD20158.1 HCR008Wp [Eremothecium sinecaudum]